jgi:uncharacterized protein (TIGR03435 family)
MRAIIAEAALAIGGSFAASLLLKVTLTLGLALLLTRLAHRSRAAVRHVLLAAAFAVLLALPAASFIIPARDVEVRRAPAASSAAPAAIVPFDIAPSPSHTGILAAAQAPVPLAVTAPALLATAWALGVLACLVPILAGVWQMRRLRRSGSPWRRGEALVRALSADARLYRRIRVLQHAAVPGPMTCGLLRPAVVLPLDADAWSDDELGRALVHELEHIRRGDWATHCLARVICALYWFHPLVWLAWRRLRLEAERACDDAVLRRAEATAYADQLVLLAERLSSTTRQPLLAMAACRDLTTRVRAVLDAGQTRGRASAPSVATALAAAAVLVAAIAPLRAVPQGASAPQGAQEPALAFEVASVRRNTTGVNEQYIRRDQGGNVTVVNMPLRALITFAYQIQSFQLEGGPDWIASDRFDIVAKPGREMPITSPFEPGRDPLRLMLQTLLADRFGLAVHKETKDLPIFELVMARRDGQPGPALRPAAADCAALMAAAQAAARAGGPPPAPADRRSCGISMSMGRIVFGGNPLTAFANTLAPLAQRVVVDRTGLAGNWDFEMTFAPELRDMPFGPPPPGAQLPDVDPNLPSLFTALEEQLGLKLQATRGPVEVLVIDRVEPLAEN